MKTNEFAAGIIRPRIQRFCSLEMLHLSPWQAVSVRPVIRRDISIVVDVAADAETLGDRARAALGDGIDDPESAEVLNATAYADLPRNGVVMKLTVSSRVSQLW